MMDHAVKGALANAMAKVKAVVVRGVLRKTEDVGGIIEAAIDYLDQQPDGVEVFQPQGTYFRAPATAECIGFAPTASASALVCGLAFDRDTAPSEGGIGEGEGGLYYAGSFKVFLAADGTVHLGAKAADDWVPCDSKVQTEFSRLKSELDAVKTDLDTLLNVLSNWTVAPMDGGLALQTAAKLLSITASPADPGATASTTTRVKQ